MSAPTVTRPAAGRGARSVNVYLLSSTPENSPQSSVRLSTPRRGPVRRSGRNSNHLPSGGRRRESRYCGTNYRGAFP